MLSRRPYHILIASNLVWSLCALIYDAPALMRLPGWSVVFIIICPLYPALLALVWLSKLRNMPQPWLLSFAALPSCIYGILALAFYPLTMLVTGFSLNAALQIPWVLFYALQGCYLLVHERQATLPLILCGLFLSSSFYVDYYTKTFNYLALTALSDTMQQSLLVGALILTWSIILLTLQRQRGVHQKNASAI